MQGRSSIFLALFDLSCQGAYITCSIIYQFGTMSGCDAPYGRGWVHLMHRILFSWTPYIPSTAICTPLHTISSMYHSVPTRKNPCEGWPSHRDSSPDPPSLKPPKYVCQLHADWKRCLIRRSFVSFLAVAFVLLLRFFWHRFRFLLFSCLNNWLIDAVVVVHSPIHPFGWQTDGQADKCQNGLFWHGSEF